tara:strand:- start:105 stop:716 length:612 start_codon:yes stop_codon:yes gene_type:complete
MSEEILNKKIKMEMKLSNHLLKESEELFDIYEQLFKEDFSKEISFMSHKDAEKIEKEKMKNPLDFIEEEVEEAIEESNERDPELYKIYKKIVMKTHPDRVKDESMVDLFDTATKAMNENDWMGILNIAIILDIKTPELTEELRQKIQENILETNSKVKSLQNTAAWVWANTAEQNKDKIRKSIRAMMGIDESEFEVFLNSTQE